MAEDLDRIAENGGLVRGARDAASTQILDDGIWDGEKTLKPPYDPRQLSAVYEQDTIANKSIDIYATNVFGTGYRLRTRSGETEGDNLAKAKDFLENINPDDNFTKVIENMIVDYKTVGYAAWEVGRNKRTKQPERIYNIPIATVRVAKGDKKFKSGDRFVQIEDYSTKEPVWYNKYRARPDERTEENGFQPDLNGDGETTNEIMWFKSANPSNRFYGLSPSITLLRTYLITKYSQQFNVDQFESGMLQKFLILLEGGKLTKDSISGLKSFIEEASGQKKWSQIPILQVTGGVNAKASIEKLTEGPNESSFLETLKHNREDVYIAFGVPPILLGITENATLANQTAQQKKFYDNEIRPIEETIEAKFNKMFAEDFGWKDVVLEAVSPEFNDKAVENEIATSQFDRGALSTNELRATLGKEAIEGGDDAYIKTPFGVILVKDIPKLEAELFAEGQNSKMANIITSGLLGFRKELEAEVAKGKAMSGTEQSDDTYPDAKKLKKEKEDKEKV